MAREFKRKIQRENYLYEAIAALKTPDESKQFLYDLLTPLELEGCANRWSISSLLFEGRTQVEIAKYLGVSSATVSRFNGFIKRGKCGYKKAWKRLQ